MKYRCPVCKKNLARTAHKSKFFPFCSPRCKLVDLGSWLDSEYKIVTKTPEKANNGNTAG